MEKENELMILLTQLNDSLLKIVGELETMNSHLYAIGCEIRPIAGAIDGIDKPEELRGITLEGLEAIGWKAVFCPKCGDERAVRKEFKPGERFFCKECGHEFVNSEI